MHLPSLPAQVLEGQEGAQAVGWPAFHKSMIHASPMLYDFDFDGVRDIMLATYDGEILFFKDTVREGVEGSHGVWSWGGG